MIEECAMLMPPPQEVNVDRPFLYRIIDKKRNVTLFSGRVSNPNVV